MATPGNENLNSLAAIARRWRGEYRRSQPWHRESVKNLREAAAPPASRAGNGGDGARMAQVCGDGARKSPSHASAISAATPFARATERRPLPCATSPAAFLGTPPSPDSHGALPPPPPTLAAPPDSRAQLLKSTPPPIRGWRKSAGMAQENSQHSK